MGGILSTPPKYYPDFGTEGKITLGPRRTFSFFRYAKIGGGDDSVRCVFCSFDVFYPFKDTDELGNVTYKELLQALSFSADKKPTAIGGGTGLTHFYPASGAVTTVYPSSSNWASAYQTIVGVCAVDIIGVGNNLIGFVSNQPTTTPGTHSLDVSFYTNEEEFDGNFWQMRISGLGG